MSVITNEEYRARTQAIRTLSLAQAHSNLVQAGCCPSATIVDFGTDTQHAVYCEEYAAPGFTHNGPHRGLAGVGVWGIPYEWQWTTSAP